jgi:hypothetical protein
VALSADPKRVAVEVKLARRDVEPATDVSRHTASRDTDSRGETAGYILRLHCLPAFIVGSSSGLILAATLDGVCALSPVDQRGPGRATRVRLAGVTT